MNREIETMLKKVQNCCLDIVSQIDAICKKHGIEYSLCAGSVIGQYLYRGFIPWDDDIDILMTRKNYNRFLKIAEAELPAPYRLVKSGAGNNTNVLFSKVINEKSTMVERGVDGNYKVSGIFVDITVFDKLPRNQWIRAYDILIMKLMHISYVGKIKGRNPLRNLIAFVLSGKKERLFDYLKRILEKNDMYSEYDYAELYYGLTISYDRSIFESYSDVEFEGKKLSMMTDYMGYLETRYGRKEFYRDDANAKPPHLVYVSTDKSYEDFKIENISSDCVVARNKPF